MKNVKKSTRLQLNRESLRSLSEVELEQVGGASQAKCLSILTLTGGNSNMGLCGSSVLICNNLLTVQTAKGPINP